VQQDDVDADDNDEEDDEDEDGSECSSGASFAILGVNICLAALWLSAFKPALIYAE